MTLSPRTTLAGFAFLVTCVLIIASPGLGFILGIATVCWYRRDRERERTAGAEARAERLRVWGY